MTDPKTVSDSSDLYEGEDDFTVESLDGRADPPVRAGMAAGWRYMRHLHRPRWLMRRRAGVTALTVVLVATLLLVGTGLAGQWWQQGRLAVLWHLAPSLTRTTIVPAAPGTLPPMGSWQHIPLPTTDRIVSLELSPTDPRVVLVCTSPKSNPTSLQTTEGAIGLWRTSDTGQHWQALPIPARAGFYCAVQMAAGAPQRLLLNVFGSGGCQTSHPLLSTDDGLRWRSLAPPLPPLPEKMEECSVVAAVTPHHIFASVGYTVLVSVSTTRTSSGTSTVPNYQSASWTTRSDNDGQTWTAPASTMPPHAYPAGNALGDDRLPLTALDPYFSPGNPPDYGTRFWTSSDLGDSWQPQAILQGFSAELLLAPPGVTLATASASKPLYALSGFAAPWYTFEIQAAQISSHSWALVPPLPVRGATAEHTGVIVVLAATPSGKLLVLGLGPQATFPSGSSVDDRRTLTQWLWEWDPGSARWYAIMPLPRNAWPSQCSTPCWHGAVSVGADSQGSGASLWLIDDGAIGEMPVLLRLQLSEPV